jgi:erythromycin esterase
MIKFLLAIVCLQSLSCAYAQNSIKRYVQENAVSISSIQPDAGNFEDLEKIGKAIGDSKIVMLGEQDHGDAPAYLAKTRLIKYLHEKKGFNVLAFETDFFSMNDGWSALEKDKSSMNSFIIYNINPVWTFCHTCKDLLFTYIPSTCKTSAPMVLTGFDNQTNTMYSKRYLAARLDSMMRSLKLSVTRQPDYQQIIATLDSLQYLSYLRKDTNHLNRCSIILKQIKTEIQQKLEKDDFWSMVVDNLIASTDQYHGRSTFVESNNIRDLQMATNLRWLSKTRFAGDKIIVWAANQHVAKFKGPSPTGTGEERVTMGSVFAADSALRQKTYIVGFTSHSGKAGRVISNTYELLKPFHRSFENWIDKKSMYSFVDFKQFSGAPQQFYMKALSHRQNLNKYWTQIFDGIFYIKDMYPCERLPVKRQ